MALWRNASREAAAAVMVVGAATVVVVVVAALRGDGRRISARSLYQFSSWTCWL